MNILTNAFFNDILTMYKTKGDSGYLKLMLLDETAQLAISANVSSVSDLKQYEVTGTGYDAGGKEVEDFLISDDTKLVASPVRWTNSAIKAKYAVLYDDEPTLEENKRVLVIYDFGSNMETTDNGTFEVAWNATNGVFNLTQQ